MSILELGLGYDKERSDSWIKNGLIINKDSVLGHYEKQKLIKNY